MGTYDNGAFGSFHGRVGNLVGSSWKGINYMKAWMNDNIKLVALANGFDPCYLMKYLQLTCQ